MGNRTHLGRVTPRRLVTLKRILSGDTKTVSKEVMDLERCGLVESVRKTAPNGDAYYKFHVTTYGMSAMDEFEKKRSNIVIVPEGVTVKIGGVPFVTIRSTKFYGLSENLSKALEHVSTPERSTSGDSATSQASAASIQRDAEPSGD